MAGEARYTTMLIGMDGEPRTTTTKGKIAEQHFRSWAEDIVRRVPRDVAQSREAAFDAYLARLERNRLTAQTQEMERDALSKARKAEQREAERASREEESGEVTLRVYEDLGPVWTRQWLREEIAPDVPEIVHCGLSTTLTCKALRRGVEALKERRARRQVVRDPAALVAEVAAAWMKSRPTFRLPVAQALELPVERLAPSR